MRTLSIEDVKDVLAGFAVLGSGGGGSAAAALERLEQTHRGGFAFRLAELDELGPERAPGVHGRDRRPGRRR